jgi:hypothetical protein
LEFGIWDLEFPGQAGSFFVAACPGCVPVECRKLAGSRRFTLALIDAFVKGKDSNAPILSQKPPVKDNNKLSGIQK